MNKMETTGKDKIMEDESKMAKNLPQYTREFVRDTGSNLIIIDNLVYDLTYFFDEHPGGCEVLYEHMGLDATESFENVGHSGEARNLMFKYLVGEIVVNQRIDRIGSKYITPSKSVCPMRGVAAS